MSWYECRSGDKRSHSHQDFNSDVGTPLVVEAGTWIKASQGRQGAGRTLLGSTQWFRRQQESQDRESRHWFRKQGRWYPKVCYQDTGSRLVGPPSKSKIMVLLSDRARWASGPRGRYRTRRRVEMKLGLTESKLELITLRETTQAKMVAGARGSRLQRVEEGR